MEASGGIQVHKVGKQMNQFQTTEKLWPEGFHYTVFLASIANLLQSWPLNLKNSSCNFLFCENKSDCSQLNYLNCFFQISSLIFQNFLYNQFKHDSTELDEICCKSLFHTNWISFWLGTSRDKLALELSLKRVRQIRITSNHRMGVDRKDCGCREMDACHAVILEGFLFLTVNPGPFPLIPRHSFRVLSGPENKEHRSIRRNSPLRRCHRSHGYPWPEQKKSSKGNPV